MTKKLTGLTASSLALSEIRQGDKWQDKSGEFVIIESYQFNRVSFYREGYSSPCIYPYSRFIKAFQLVENNNQ